MAEREFEFELVFALPEGSLDEEAVLDALYEAGSDDATVGLGKRGAIGLAFVRTGADPESGKPPLRPRPACRKVPYSGRHGQIS